MNNAKYFATILVLAGLLGACSSQAAVSITPTQPVPTGTSIPSTATLTFTPLPTETALPTDTAAPTAPSCAIPLSPTDNATVPARGPFDFTWTSFEGASSYVISIGPADWYPTDFPVADTTLTRYMETFPDSPSYQWSITALNASGQKLCTVGPYTFVTSKDMYATPSFDVVTTDEDLQTDSDSTPDLVISIAVNEYSCRLVVTIMIRTDGSPVNAYLRHGTDPDHLDHEQSFPSQFIRDSTGVGRFELDIVKEFTAGETYYFWAHVNNRVGHVYETELVSHTMACGQ